MASIINLRQGWNAGARSIRYAEGDLEATFEPLESLTDVFIGLGPAIDVTLPHEQTHSLRLSRLVNEWVVNVHEKGVFKDSWGAYIEGDLLAIRRVEGVVTYYMNGSLLYTSATPSTGRVYLTAALWQGGDRI